MKVIELFEARQSDTLVGRQVAIKFPEEEGGQEKWWLGEITVDNGKMVTVDYYNTKFNDNDYGYQFQRKVFVKPTKKDAMGFALVNAKSKSSKGLDTVADMVAGYEKPAKAEPTEKPAKATAPAFSGEKFVVTPAIMKRLEAYAEDGDRIAIDGKNIYMGFGNRSGLHSYLQTALADTFKKWPNAKKKLEAGNFSKIEVLEFRNIDRDRGRWIVVKTYEAPK
ncbi:hypothetical protein [Acinetobacter sp.]|uniref:hypothetical protein n=1 Tax=Acinetobacter sp. TaxID=472 RepID=UPI00388DFCEB